MCIRIYSHDFGGYPFPPELARSLAARGHEVRHVFCESLTTTPSGGAYGRPEDPPNYTVAPVRLKEPLKKSSFVKRWRQENEYGRLVARDILQFRPDVVLSANTPLDAQRRILRATRQTGARFVFWVQDLVGVAASRLLARKIPVAGRLIGQYYESLEARLLRNSDCVVVITEDFIPLLASWKIDTSTIQVIENWAPLTALPVRSHDNAWATGQGIAETFNFIYSGTLGMKHNPELLLALAKEFRDDGNVRVVVLTQGIGAEWLKEKAAATGLANLHVKDFAPYSHVPDVMGTADVLVAILEPDAGIFSVPSKVLSYLCAGRSLLAALPGTNLAARILEREQAGLVTPPDDIDAFVAAGRRLYDDAALRDTMGTGARAFAERAFDIERITDRFAPILYPHTKGS
jgi:colanic acid biosynthesis glycosyl transferase WcaI